MKAVVGGSASTNIGLATNVASTLKAQSNLKGKHVDNPTVQVRRGTPGSMMTSNGNAVLSPYKRNLKNSSIISGGPTGGQNNNFNQSQKQRPGHPSAIPTNAPSASQSTQQRQRENLLVASGGMAMNTPTTLMRKQGIVRGGSAKRSSTDQAKTGEGTPQKDNHYSAVNVIHTQNSKDFKQLLSQLQQNTTSAQKHDGTVSKGNLKQQSQNSVGIVTQQSTNQQPYGQTNNKISNNKSQTNMNAAPGTNQRANKGGGKNYSHSNRAEASTQQQQHPSQNHHGKQVASMTRANNHQQLAFGNPSMSGASNNGSNLATPHQQTAQNRNSSVPYNNNTNRQNGYGPPGYQKQQQPQNQQRLGSQYGGAQVSVQGTPQQPVQQKGEQQSASNNRFNNGHNGPPKVTRRIENLPRTGIEYPIMKHQNVFISQHREQEPLYDSPTAQHLVDEYVANDAEKANASVPNQQVVYDSIEPSHYYENTVNDMFIDEKQLIELPNPAQQSDGVNEPYQKRYYFNPNNLPYSLEQSHSYSARTIPAGEKVTAADKQAAQGNKGPRLNRYYETLKPFYKLKTNIVDETLQFESRFESGNLRRAIKVSDTEYDLFLKNDYGTTGYTQWYFFQVKNTRKDKVYRFNIVNMMKPDSNYNQGMKPLVYSVREAEINNLGWYRDGQNIAYYQNQRKKRTGTTGPTSSLPTSNSYQAAGNIPQCANQAAAQKPNYWPHYYSLTFEVVFKHDNDTVYFSHCYPYTYSDQCEFVRKVCHMHNKNKVRKTVLCKSLGGNEVDMLIVTNFLSDPVDIAVRKSVILTSRVHPGETGASFMMNGVIDFLVSDDPSAELLRNTFVFKIIPMLNPDGVIVGNYRCSLIGQDLNRNWIGSSSKFYPINYHTKLMMKRTLESRDIFFFCDMHGHSTGRNVFMFGNTQSKASDKNKEKIFPMLFSENDDMFSFEDCSFGVQKSKESCARQVMWRDFQLINSFTLEASFLGPDKGLFKGLHFNTTMYERMGRVFCKTLVDYVDNQEKVARIMGELKIRFPTAGIAGPARTAVTNQAPAENASTDTKQAQDGKAKEVNGTTNNNNITTNNSHQYNATTNAASRSATDYTASSSGAPTNTTGPLQQTPQQKAQTTPQQQSQL